MTFDTTEVTNVITLGANRKRWTDRYTKDGVVWYRDCEAFGDVDPQTGLATRAAETAESIVEAELNQLLGE